MTIAEWLEAREPRPPDELAARLRVALGASVRRSVGDAPDVLLQAAARVLEDLVRHPCMQRDQAMDLLTADALVTYAFEAAAEAPEQLEARATAALARLAALAPEAAP